MRYHHPQSLLSKMYVPAKIAKSLSKNLAIKFTTVATFAVVSLEKLIVFLVSIRIVSRKTLKKP
jgi:hypothetical protein